MRLLFADVHLSACETARTRSFLSVLSGAARQAKEIYLLGDIFDLWLGDDDEEELAVVVRDALAALTQSGVAVFIQRGNRDFLLGARFCRQTGCRLLPALHVLAIGGRRLLLTHGDLLCGDAPYLRYRTLVQSAAFAAVARGLPLSWRRRAAALMRAQSQRRRRPAVLSLPQATAVMRRHDCRILVHGHTHLADEERWSDGGEEFIRHGLPDWESAPGYLQLAGDGSFRRLVVGLEQPDRAGTPA